MSCFEESVASAPLLLLKLSRLDGTGELVGPPQSSLFNDGREIVVVGVGDGNDSDVGCSWICERLVSPGDEVLATADVGALASPGEEVLISPGEKALVSPVEEVLMSDGEEAPIGPGVQAVVSPGDDALDEEGDC